MNRVVRGLLFGIAAVLAGFVVLLAALSVWSATLNTGGGHMVVLFRLASPPGASFLALLLLLFATAYAYGSRGAGRARSH